MHLGKSETLTEKELVGIFDIDKATVSEDTRNFLKQMQEGYKTVNLATDLPAAFVLSANEYSDRVYLTALSAGVLKKRACGIGIKGRNGNGTKL